MTHVITWTDLKESIRQALPLGDRIEVSESRHDGQYLEITLEIAPELTGWRSVTLAGGDVVNGVSDIWIARLELEKPWLGPVSLRAGDSQLRRASIFLGKNLPSGKRNTSDYHLLESPPPGTSIKLRWIAG